MTTVVPDVRPKLTCGTCAGELFTITMRRGARVIWITLVHRNGTQREKDGHLAWPTPWPPKKWRGAPWT